MRCFGLIGFPLSHSFSAKYFAEKFERESLRDCTYSNFPLEQIGLLNQLIEQQVNLIGLNVTIPYKEQIIPYLHSVEEEAAQIGAVNTIKIIRNGGSVHLKGYNTDAYGFQKSLEPFIKKHFSKALILGTGGASKAVAYVLNRMGIEVTYVSRIPRNPGHLSYEELTPAIIAACQVIVNTSPAGMYPNTDVCPAIPYECLTPGHVLYDLIYNPAETKFLALGRLQGAATINGLQMLHLQADKAWEIWNS
ncbi:MAG: shikimate dehydrogenase [Bacteroidales bacterium]|nr:shikimate dehydrogenase [Bacteroidales bacterium]